MTIGERIRFFRSHRRLTSTQLAERSGIHPVSIRKYETDKMIPKEEQIKKIADALSVSYYALAGTESIKFPETKGDLVGLIIMLFKTGIIEITGEKDKDNHLSPKTARLKLNPDITVQFSAFLGKEAVDVDNVMLKMKDGSDWENLICWVNLYHDYNKALEEQNENMNDDDIEKFERATRDIIRAEMLTQTSTVLLDESNAPKVKRIPGYH